MTSIKRDKILKQLEVELHQPAVRADRGKLEALLHDSFTECGRSGRLYTREEILEEVCGESSPPPVWSQDFSTTKLSDELVLLTYKSAHIGADGTLTSHAFRSSLWQLTSQGWKMRFHQGTGIEAFEQNED